MKLTGQKLKEKRESARLTISEISLATKINPKVIAAMESGDMDSLPAKTFLRGFVRSYAAFLKMNTSEVLAVFNQEMGEQTPAVNPTAPAAPAAPSVDVNGDGANTLRMIVVGGIVLLILLILGVRGLIQKYEKEKMTETSTEIGPDKEKSPFDEANTAMPPTPAPTSSLAIAPSPSPSPLPSPSPSVVAAAAASPSPSPTPSPSVKPSPSPSPSPTPSPSPSKAAAEKAKPGQRHEIILEALDKVEVKYQESGKSKTLTLAPNEVHTLIINEPITLEVSDGGALNITDNGKDKGPAGDLGHPKKVSIP